MACSCQKIGAMKKHRHRVSGIGDEMMPAVLVSGGVIAAHELKGMLPASITTSLGANTSLIVNGLGIAAAVFVPGIVKDASTKKWLEPLMWGFGAQCVYSLFLNDVVKAVPPVVNRTWATYALGGKRMAGRQQGMTYALGCVTNPDGSKSYVPVMKPMNTTQGPGAASNPAPSSVVVPAATTVKTMMPTKQAVTNAKQPMRKTVVGGF